MRNTYCFRNENNDIKGTTYIDIARTDPVANLKKIYWLLMNESVYLNVNKI